MSGTILKWGIPAFFTVVGGTLAAVLTSGAAIPVDLEVRSRAQLAETGSTWAAVSFDAQDATLTGTASTQQMIDDATASVAAVRGVRSVVSNVVLAEYVSPFPFVVTVSDGRLALSGGLPDEAARGDLLEAAGEGATDGLRLMSGAPDRANWIAAARYAIEQALRMDEGEVALADLDLTLSGRARSGDSYDELIDPPAPPAGISIGYAEVAPPVASPYEWHAEYDGRKLILSGVVPSDETAAAISALAPADVVVSTSMTLASGEPAGFDETTALLLRNLLQLECGSASISDTTSALDGSPADASVAEAVRVAMTPSGTRLTLGAPNVSDYWLRADRTDQGIMLSGYVPDEATLERLEGMDKVDASALEVGRGAPERFVSAVEFVIEAMGRMSEGHASIQGTVISIEGRAATLADFTATQTKLQLGAPQGLILGASDIRPPKATPFTFVAEKAPGGGYSLEGHVPSDAARQAIRKALPAATVDKLVLADGNPADFDTQVGRALGVLSLLDSGTLKFDGTAWSITGAADTPSKALAAEQAFAAAGLRQAGWAYDVSLPQAAEQKSLPIISPYEWRAQKSADGTILISGFSPSEQFKRYIAVHAGGKVLDSSGVGGGAPDHFVGDALAGIDALLQMPQGSFSLAGGKWTLTGDVADNAARYRIETQLDAATDTSAWHVAIQAADAAPVVSPFTWSAVKAAGGAVTLNGYVPSDGLREAIAIRVGGSPTDKTLVASGEPQAFDTTVMAGLDALDRLESGQVAFDGRNWSISGQPLTAADADAAGAALSSGDWTVALAEPTQIEPESPVVPPVEEVAEATPEPEVPAEGPAPTPEPVEAEPTPEVAEIAPQPDTPAPSIPVVRDYVFEAKKAIDAPVVLQGSVPADAMRRFLAVVTETEPNEDLRIAGDLPEDFIPNAEAGSRALMLLADGEFGLDGDRWVFVGRAETEADKQAALTALNAAPAIGRWETSVTLLPPLLVCEQKVGAFQTRNAILFDSGSDRISKESDTAIDELAGYLALCPEATVNVEGHTDADGDAETNLALSVYRAEAVVDALILRGVSPDRLYAVGYGESLPVASNDTRAGKQANRRIAFTLADE